MRVFEYRLLTASSTTEIEEQIRRLANEGWRVHTFQSRNINHLTFGRDPDIMTAAQGSVVYSLGYHAEALMEREREPTA